MSVPVAILALLAASPPAPQSAAPVDPIEAICARFTGFDHDGDGKAELASLRVLSAAGERGARVLVLVEERLAAPLADAPDLQPRVARLVEDLAHDGYRAHALAVQLAPHDAHQDGRYVLALREVLRAVAGEGELAGAILFGHFPDAFVVRTCNWRRKGDVTLRKGKPDQAVHYLRRVPEDVAHRADIVLSDLDGRWEDVYVQPRTRLETVTAIYSVAIPAPGGSCVDLARGGVEYEDFFHVSDGKLEVRETLGADGARTGYALFLDDRSAGHECSPVDGAHPNPLAAPDIVVSRIDARGTALRPRASIHGTAGEGLLDADGVPQTVTFASKGEVPDWRSAIWEPDPVLERRLLVEYLDRNHAYRTRTAKVAWRPASVACDLGSGFREMARAASDWVASVPTFGDVAGRPTLERVVAWFAYPALLRTVRAHSDAWGSVFRAAKVDGLAAHVGGPAWSWSPRGDRLEPSLRSACAGGKLDWFLLRTLWENHAIAPEPSFYHHTGCHGISPPGAARLAFDHPAYGQRQGAEALLLFGNGLALVGRSKVFYDEPKGFAAALAEGATFGAAWARYFELEARAATWGAAGGDIGRKRAYFWSVLGDWTLRLGTAAPGR